MKITELLIIFIKEEMTTTNLKDTLDLEKAEEVAREDDLWGDFYKWLKKRE